MQALLFGAAILSAPIHQQKVSGRGLTGQISGFVQDSSGAAVTASRITLFNSGTAQSRQGTTDLTGAFLFTELLAGDYDISVEAAGFKAYHQKGVVLTATERVTLRAIGLEVGQVSETLSATANLLQTESAERSGVHDFAGSETLAQRPRLSRIDAAAPGNSRYGESLVPRAHQPAGININGNRRGTIALTFDGVTNMDTGNASGPFPSPSLDAIAEVKVLLTNCQNEYGRSSGGTINLVVKNGTTEFHGDGYYSVRNTAFNANEFFQ